MGKRLYKTFVFCMCLLLFHFGASALRNEISISGDTVPQKRDHSSSDTSYSAPQKPASSYGEPAKPSSGYGEPAKPAEETTLQKFKFIAVFSVLCIMILGVVWVLLRVSYFAELGAAGTSRNAKSIWSGIQQSILEDFSLNDLLSTILDSNAINGVLEKILDSSK